MFELFRSGETGELYVVSRNGKSYKDYNDNPEFTVIKKGTYKQCLENAKELNSSATLVDEDLK
jgi:hypothetical protein